MREKVRVHERGEREYERDEREVKRDGVKEGEKL